MKQLALGQHIYRAACCLLLCMPLLSHANDNIRFSGFASFVTGKSLGDDTFRGIPDSFELRDMSKLGLRMTADLGDQLSMTTQMVALGASDYEPEFDWIFASYNFTPNLVLHIGKYVTPYFMYSDYVDIGYAYQWTAAPHVVYGRGVNKTLDGAKLMWSQRIGSWTSELSLMTGTDNSSLSNAGLDTDLVLKDSIGAAWQMERDWLSLRAVYLTSSSTVDLTGTQLQADNLLDRILSAENPQTGFNAAQSAVGELAAQAITITADDADAIMSAALNDPSAADFKNTFSAWDDADVSFTGFGAALNFSQVFAVAEITEVQFDEIIALGKSTTGYLTLGTYLPRNTSIALTLYEQRDKASKAFIKDVTNSYADFNTDPGSDAFAAAFAAASATDAVTQDGEDAGTIAGTTLGVMNGFLEGGLEPTVEGIQVDKRQGVSLSGRWDFHSNAALKVEYLVEDVKNLQAETRPRAIRFGLDLVF